jgi:hypothetical protein
MDGLLKLNNFRKNASKKNLIYLIKIVIQYVLNKGLYQKKQINRKGRKENAMNAMDNIIIIKFL